MRFTSLLLVLAGACATASSSVPPSSDAADAGAAAGPPAQATPAATAVLEPRSGSNTSGTARITPTASGVVVLIEVQNAAPGEHGVHVHETGDCSDPAAMSAGAHFNPKSAEHHGGPSTPVRHGGDLGNMQVDSNGRGLLVVAVGDLTLENVAGRSIVVHQTADDLKTDPAGNSGARVACGTIQSAKGSN